MKTVFIYAHKEKNTRRYVGMSKHPEMRLKQHIAAAKKGVKTYHANWIRSLLIKGETPVLEILDEVPESQWEFWEREWIRISKEEGHKLTNATDGGEGGATRLGCVNSREHREKISAGTKGKAKSEAHCLSLSKAKTGVKLGPQSPETIENRISKLRGRRRPAFSLEWCANLSESLKGNQRRKGKKDSEETREKKRIASTGRTHTREVREKLRVSKLGKNNPNYGKKRSVESRRKQSEALKLRWKIKKETA